jgi:chemotaxis signal transduction protein
MNNNNMPWVVFKIDNKLFSISSEFVQSIIQMIPITKIPNDQEYLKGIIRYRDSIYKVLDIRKIFGLKTLDDKIFEFSELIKQRKQDHLNWLDELNKSVLEKRKFKLTTDPTKCAFGKWYYSFETEDIGLKEQLDKFELPHNTIHKLAIEVEKLFQNGESDKISKLIEKTRNTSLAELIKLFDGITSQYKKSLQELLIILEQENFRTAFPVDQVLTVEYLNEIADNGFDKDFMGFEKNKIIQDMAQRENGDLVLRLSDEVILRADINVDK